MSIQFIDVANEAMFMIGGQSIQSLSDPKNRQDRLVSSIIDGVRKDLLKDHRWNGATKRVSLAADVATPAFGYTVQYSLPADFLRLDRTIPEDQNYKIEGNKLLTDDDVVNIIYIANEPDPNVLGHNFQTAMKFLLASRCAKALTGDEQLSMSMRNEYDKELASARYTDSDQASSAEKIRPTLFLSERSRYGNSGSTSSEVPLL